MKLHVHVVIHVHKKKFDFIDKTPNTDYRHYITQTWKTFIPFKCREHSINYSIQFTNPVIQTIFFNEATFEFVLLQHKVSQSSMFVASTKKKRYFSLTTYLDLQSYGNDFVWIIAVTYSLHSSVQLSLWKLRTSITIVHIHWNSRGPSPTWGSLSPWQGAAQRVYLSFLYPKFT